MTIFGEMPKDGNCFFHAVISQLILKDDMGDIQADDAVHLCDLVIACKQYGCDYAAATLRSSVVDYMRKNPILPLAGAKTVRSYFIFPQKPSVKIIVPLYNKQREIDVRVTYFYPNYEN